ncbi:MAG TPA: hypothetical protein VHZ04_00175 [Candidatus Paceibacterota bacterium]|jgi:hypothetical protein|nr:hypothetical protein [Candidatus Paceibacterota bacterium]
MALYFKTSDPRGLLAEFKKAIDAHHIETWSYDSDDDFTHTAQQWKSLAWLRPEIRSDELALFIVTPKNKTLSSEVYAIYHGRFIEAMVRHCDRLFSNGIATALPKEKDRIQG